jgi:hypothetical protein
MPKPNFLIAVFSQPVSSFDKWIARGVNALVSHEPEGGRVKKFDWEAAATAKGLYFMDYPSDDDAVLQNEARQTHRLAFMQDDEPDLTRDINNDPLNRFIKDGPFKGWTRPELLVARYNRCKAAAPDSPVFCNFAGPQITPAAYTHGQGHKPYLAAADWLAHDWYVKNKNYARYPVSLIGMAMDRLAQWSAPELSPKPQFVFIECSDQKISPLGRCPTPDEVEEEIDLAVTKGARGIIYFPQKPPPGFQYDAMPSEIVERITAVNDRINRKFNLPPPNEPTPRELLSAVQGLQTRLDGISRQLTALQNRGFRASIDLNPHPPTEKVSV